MGTVSIAASLLCLLGPVALVACALVAACSQGGGRSTVRAPLVGLASGLIVALTLGLLVAWAIIVERTNHAHGEVRATIEWNIGAYERWWREPGRDALRQYDPAVYQALLDEFMLRHQAVADYRAWWHEMRGDDPQPADLRDPWQLDRYLDYRLPHHLPFDLPGQRRHVRRAGAPRAALR
jgi:hypothetical protein